MITVDRTPRKNYLLETLKNLERSGVWKSEHLNSFHLFDSGGSKNWPGEVLFGSGIQGEIHVHTTVRPRVANENVVAAQATRQGNFIFTTQGDWFYVSNLSKLYIDALTSGDKINYYYEI